MLHFDDALLDDPAHLARHGDRLRHMALVGARLRSTDPAGVATCVAGPARPRAVIALGAEARLLRAVVEPTCPVPFVAWPLVQLPSWVGPLDLVVVLAGGDLAYATAVEQAVRRGSQVVVVAPQGAPLIDHVPRACVISTPEPDEFVAAVLALVALAGFELAPPVSVPVLADALDAVAEANGPRHPLGRNPAKDLACALADTTPLVWGDPILAARAARRVVEAIRAATHRPALAADISALRPLLASATPVDLFADPVEDPGTGAAHALLLLTDGSDPAAARELTALARARSLRVETLHGGDGSPIVRYAVLAQQGLYAAAYLAMAMAE